MIEEMHSLAETVEEDERLLLERAGEECGIRYCLGELNELGSPGQPASSVFRPVFCASEEGAQKLARALNELRRLRRPVT